MKNTNTDAEMGMNEHVMLERLRLEFEFKKRQMQSVADKEVQLKKMEVDAQMGPRQYSNDVDARVNHLP